MISSIRHKQSILWTLLSDAMGISAKEILKNHTDKERFTTASSCIVTGILTFPAQTIKSLLPFLYIMLVIFKLISSIRLLRQSVQHTGKPLWNTLPKNNSIIIVNLFVNFQISIQYLVISIQCRRINFNVGESTQTVQGKRLWSCRRNDLDVGESTCR